LAGTELRDAGDRPQGDLRRVCEEARQADRPRGQEHLQPEDEEVLRLLRQLRSRSGELPDRSVGRAGHAAWAHELGRRAACRQENQGQASDPRRHRPVGRARHGDGDAHDPVCVRRLGTGRARKRRARFAAHARRGRVRQGALRADDDARGDGVGRVVEQPCAARRQGVPRAERDLDDARRGGQEAAHRGQDRAHARAEGQRPRDRPRARDGLLRHLEIRRQHRGREEVPRRLHR